MATRPETGKAAKFETGGVPSASRGANNRPGAEAAVGDLAQPRLREHDDGREQTQTQDAEGPSTGGLAWRAAGPKCGETLAPGADRRLVGPRGLGASGLPGRAGRGGAPPHGHGQSVEPPRSAAGRGSLYVLFSGY